MRYNVEIRNEMYAVVNLKTNEVQSYWTNKSKAHTTCKDLNSAVKKGLVK